MFNCCVADYTGETNFFELDGYTSMYSGMPSAYSQFDTARISVDQRKHGGGGRVVQVQCMTLSELLSRAGIDRIDFLSLDTEGSEFNILQSIDFGAQSVRSISVENNYGSARFERFLVRHGYRLAAIAGVDEIYVKQ